MILQNVPTGSFKWGMVKSYEVNGTKGIIPTYTDVTTTMVEMQAGGSYTFNFNANHNTLVYVLKGTITINHQETLTTKQMALMNHDGTNFSIEALDDTMLFVGSGALINEPIASHGPFVMNTQTEIMEAFKDYQQGKMGVLIEA